MVECLISTHHWYEGAALAKCELCDCHVYEDPLNLERIRAAPEGHIICITCFVKMKKDYPEMHTEGQMWKGQLREPEPIPPFKKLSDWMGKKG